MFILIETDIVNDVNGLQTHFMDLSLGHCVCQCEHTIIIVDGL